jgi:hypothetical protein
MQGQSGLLNVMTIPPGAGLGQRIVIDGFRGAIFEYSSTNALVSSWASKAGIDPFGNAYPAGFSIGSGSVFAGTDFTINSSGEFFYSSTPAAGNLVSSNTNASGTGGFTDAYFAGFTEYGTFGGGPVAINMFNGVLSFYTAATQAGPWTQQVKIGIDTSGDVTMTAVGNFIITGGSALSVPTSLELFKAGRAILTSSDDGNQYNLGKICIDNGAAGDTLINSTTPLVIGSAKVAAARYMFRMRCVLTMGATAAAAAMGLVASTGGTINYCRIQFKTFIDSNASQSVIGTLSQNTLVRYPTPSLTLSTSYIVEADGLISFSATGTVQFQAAEVTSGDSWTLVHPSYAVLDPIT